MTALNTPWAWRAKARWIHVARFGLADLSMCFVLWLIYAEVIIIGNICLYCTGVHLVDVRSSDRPHRGQPDPTRLGALTSELTPDARIR